MADKLIFFLYSIVLINLLWGGFDQVNWHAFGIISFVCVTVFCIIKFGGWYYENYYLEEDENETIN